MALSSSQSRGRTLNHSVVSKQQNGQRVPLLRYTSAAVIVARPRCGSQRGLISALVLLTAILVGLRAAPRAQEDSLDAALARAAEYARHLHAQLSGIVAEELYLQEVRSWAPAESSSLPERRTLRSDLLLVKPAALPRYVEYRDVFEVDGAAVRDRQERLTALFLDPSETTERRLKAIVEESARHNIGRIPRNINTPLIALSFLLPESQPRFRFRQVGATQPRLTARFQKRADPSVFRVSTEMWCVEFRETRRPTVIRMNENRDFPARGRLWIDPATGVVLISELEMTNGLVSATINVSYQSEPLLGFRVPVEMRERYLAENTIIEGHATYGHFRQFQVKTQEIIGKPRGRE